MTTHPIKKRKKKKPLAKDNRFRLLPFITGVVIPALLITFIARIVLLQPFYIPSGSMHPTLVEGDQLLISKPSYGLSRYSLPFAPNVFEGKLFAAEPERGDVVVFRRNDYGRSEDWIKRVIGLPGDTVEMRNGRLWLNGQAVQASKSNAYAYPDARDKNFIHKGTIYKETLPSGVSYHVLDTGVSRGDNFAPYTVPPGHVFVLGDNRDHSQDSRFIGSIDQVYLLGRALFIHFSYDWHTRVFEFWKWPWAIRFGRFFKGFTVD